jgi:oxygen-dependent protoporphyrinogen oxidase
MFAPRGGLGTLIDRLASELGDRVHTDRRIGEVSATDGSVRVDGEAWDAAVLAIPAEEAIALVPSLPMLATRLSMFHRAPAAQVYLGFAAEQIALAGDGFGFLVAQGEDLRVLGVVFESTVWPDRAPAGQVLVRCIFGGSRDPDAARLDDATLIAQATRDVGIALGARGAPTHASVVRWSRGIAQYPVGHRDHVRAAVAAARSHRIVLAGADYRGPGVNDLCADGEAIVEELRAWA